MSKEKQKHLSISTSDRIAELKVRYHEAVTASGEAAQEKQHAKGKLTARERINELLGPRFLC